MCFYTSPGIDINYFLCTSPKQEVRVQRRTDLINEYYGAFQETLLSLNYQNIPTLKDLEADIRRKEFYGIYSMEILRFCNLISVHYSRYDSLCICSADCAHGKTIGKG
jgi:hypothetical protein